jgi:hypothetical protein
MPAAFCAGLDADLGRIDVEHPPRHRSMKDLP